MGVRFNWHATAPASAAIPKTINTYRRRMVASLFCWGRLATIGCTSKAQGCHRVWWQQRMGVVNGDPCATELELIKQLEEMRTTPKLRESILKTRANLPQALLASVRDF